MIGLGEGDKGGIIRSKNIGYLGCEFRLNEYFEWAGTDRLGQFMTEKNGNSNILTKILDIHVTREI